MEEFVIHRHCQCAGSGAMEMHNGVQPRLLIMWLDCRHGPL